MPPNMVFAPVATTTATPLPETTVEPMSTMLSRSPAVRVSSVGAGQGVATRSTGRLSPVSDDMLRKRSRAWMSRASAGTMSPDARCTMSPTTTSARGISTRPSPASSTLQVVCIVLASAAAASSLLPSCTNRKVPETAIIAKMMMKVDGSRSAGAARITSVTSDTTARSARIPVKGSTKAFAKRTGAESRWARATSFGPHTARESSTFSAERPPRLVLNSLRSSSVSSEETRRSHSSWDVFPVGVSARRAISPVLVSLDRNPLVSSLMGHLQSGDARRDTVRRRLRRNRQRGGHTIGLDGQGGTAPALPAAPVSPSGRRQPH